MAEKRHSVHKMSRERLGSLERMTKSPRNTSPAHSPLSRSFSSTIPEMKSDGEQSTDGAGGCSHRYYILYGWKFSRVENFVQFRNFRGY